MSNDSDQNEIEYLGFNARFVAFLIDSTAASIIMLPFVSHLIGDLGLSSYDLSDQSQLTELLGLMTTQLSVQLSVELLFMGTIFILFWVFKNATPGKMLFKSVIVDAQTFRAPSVSQNVIRYLGYFLSLFPLGLGFLWVAFDQRKQGWHDKLAGTVVIKGRPRPPAAAQNGEADGDD